jgi:hypothetical protein
MAAVHEVFRSSLASAPAFVVSAQGDEFRRAIIAHYYSNLMSFLEVHHDGEEKIIFGSLMERAPDSRSTIELAQAQHHEVIELIESVKGNLDSWSQQGDSKASDVSDSLGALAGVLVAHLDQEEAEIVPLAGEHMTAEEWGALPGHAMKSYTGDKIWLILGLIRENFTQQQRHLMLENMPPPAVEMWQTFGEASFNELIGQIRQAH